MDTKGLVQVERMTAVVEPVSLLLQQACGPCLAGDLAGAGALIDRAAGVVERAAVLEAADLWLWRGFARHLAYMWALPHHWEILIRLLRSHPWEPQTHSHLLHGVHFLPDIDRYVLADQHRRWAKCHAAHVTCGAFPPRDRRPDRPLRIGYVSPDFRVHCVALFLEPLLQSHDRHRFTVLGYGNVPPERRDELTGRLAAQFDLYRDIWGQDDERVAQQIREDRIDILIDLAGHTHHHRLQVFARRPAPVQMTYLGYPDTTGLQQIDYRLGDHVTDPAGADRPYSETLLRLESCFACYRAPEFSPEVCAPPVLSHGHITFGSFVGAAKYNPRVLALWAQVLAATPESVLLLRFEGAEQGVIQQQCRGAMARLGIAAERIQFDGMRPFAEHLTQYHRIDIALDTTPWSSHTSLCEALWMGVPVVTLAGDACVSRMGASVLTHAGFGHWVAGQPQDYVAIAADLARDRQGLTELRRVLRDRMRRSVVCDGAGVTRALERLLLQAWHFETPAGPDPGPGRSRSQE